MTIESTTETANSTSASNATSLTEEDKWPSTFVGDLPLFNVLKKLKLSSVGSAVIVAITYSIGMVIVNSYLYYAFGFVELGLLQVDYLLVGGVYLIITLVAIYSVFQSRLYAFEEMKKSFYGFPVKSFFGLIVVSIVSAAISSFPVYVISMILGDGLFKSLFAFNGVLGLLSSPYVLYYLALWMILVSIPIAMSIEKRIFLRYDLQVYYNYLLSIVVSLVLYAGLIYPNLSPVVAGGKPVFAKVTLDEGARNPFSKDDIVVVLKKTSDAIYVLSSSGSIAFEIPRDKVIAVQYIRKKFTSPLKQQLLSPRD